MLCGTVLLQPKIPSYAGGQKELERYSKKTPIGSLKTAVWEQQKNQKEEVE